MRRSSLCLRLYGAPLPLGKAVCGRKNCRPTGAAQHARRLISSTSACRELSRLRARFPGCNATVCPLVVIAYSANNPAMRRILPNTVCECEVSEHSSGKTPFYASDQPPPPPFVDLDKKMLRLCRQARWNSGLNELDEARCAGLAKSAILKASIEKLGSLREKRQPSLA